MLAPVADRDEPGVDDVHVVVDAERELQRARARRPTGRVGRREPVAVEEARVARPDVVEGRRGLVV